MNMDDMNDNEQITLEDQIQQFLKYNEDFGIKEVLEKELSEDGFYNPFQRKQQVTITGTGPSTFGKQATVSRQLFEILKKRGKTPDELFM
jgi:hypothetical protein